MKQLCSRCKFSNRLSLFAMVVNFITNTSYSGGGSMEEYGNLQEWASRTSGVAGPTSTGPRKRIVYGSTELVNARDFISRELTRLGKEG